ncbi:MAG: hypothetical protein HY900_22895 [Deltaproteobacteria bacterium]|nr:hypothetical protein [Deltaproteobacteria bacterium]
MKKALESATVVLVAHQFNPSIIDKLWLVKNLIVEEGDLLEGGVQAPVISQVDTRKFRLQVIPEQLTFELKDSEDGSALSSLGLLVSRLPETPYSAMGLNFLWRAQPDDNDHARLSRELFFRADLPLYRAFDEGNSCFGAYFSKGWFDGSRLKLDVKPVDAAGRKLIQFAFNFHLDLTSQERPAEINAFLKRWTQAREMSFEIFTSAVGER